MTQWYAISRHIVSRSSAACWICWPHDIHLLAWSHLSAEQQAGLRERYLRGIFPLVTPLALDPAHPFPFVSNLSLNLLVTGHGERGATVLVRVKVPVGDDIPRLLRVGDKPHFVRLEDVMAHTLDVLFPGLEVISCELFRITRNANTERDEEDADDLLELIEAEVRDRRFAPIVRLEVQTGMDPGRRAMLTSELGLNDPDDVFRVSGNACRARRWIWHPSTIRDCTILRFIHSSQHASLLRATCFTRFARWARCWSCTRTSLSPPS